MYFGRHGFITVIFLKVEKLHFVSADPAVDLFSRMVQLFIFRKFKGALDKCKIIPKLFQKKVEIFIPLEVLAWVMTA